MSDKKDERDIDEILASIDAMLAEETENTDSPSQRKDTVAQAARGSEDALGISSSSTEEIDTASKLHAFEPLDDTPATQEADKEAAVEEPLLETTQSSTDNSEVEESEPRQRIVLTEEYLEPSAQESLPLWAAQDIIGQDEPIEESNEEKNEYSISEDKDANQESIKDSSEETSQTLEQKPSEDDKIDDVLGSLDDFEMPDLDASDEENLDKSVPDKTFFFEDTPTSDNRSDDVMTHETDIEDISKDVPTEDTNEVEDKEDAQTPDPSHTDKSSANEPIEEQTAEDTNDDTNDEFDAVFDAIANDDTITFDINEAMEEDTVYDIEVLDKELVEAFVQDVVHEHDADNAEENLTNEADIAETGIEATIDEETADEEIKQYDNQAEHSEDIIEDEGVNEENVNSDFEVNVSDNHSSEDDVREDSSAEDEAEPLAEHIETSVQDAIEQDETITLNPDELDPMIEAISDDVRIKINHHLQQILPELISEALLEHLANQRDNSDD